MRTYRIANLSIQLTGAEDEVMAYRLREYQCPLEGPFDLTVDFQANCPNIELPPGEIIANTEPHAWMALKDGGYALFDRIPDISDQVLLLAVANEDWSRISVKLCKPEVLGFTVDHRHYPLLGELFKVALLYHDGLALHSSSLRYREDALLFSAPSGTGKSTHTGLWCQHYPEDTAMINDDMPAIRFIDGIPIAFGTPWSGKTELNSNISAPLKAIVFLQQDSENSIRLISGGEAAWRMIHETKKIPIHQLMEQSLAQIDRLLQYSAPYLLHCNISKQAVDTVKSALYTE